MKEQRWEDKTLGGLSPKGRRAISALSRVAKSGVIDIGTATQALDNGLIDRIGTMNDAIAEAKERAGIATARVVSYARPHGYVPNYYARRAAPSVQTQVNLLNVTAGGQLGSHQPPFMYLWIRP